MSDQLTGELNLIKRWEIHFQRKEATCGDEMTLGGEDTALGGGGGQEAAQIPSARSRAPPPANKQQTPANFQRLPEKQKMSSGVIAAGDSSLLDAAGRRQAAGLALRITAAPLTVWCEVTNASVCITAIPPVLQPG